MPTTRKMDQGSEDRLTAASVRKLSLSSLIGVVVSISVAVVGIAVFSGSSTAQLIIDLAAALPAVLIIAGSKAGRLFTRESFRNRRDSTRIRVEGSADKRDNVEVC